jgi:exonuclease SbcD
MVGVHTIGSVPEKTEDSLITVPSRDHSETATFAALPWVPERWVLRFETLFEGADNARTEYRQVMEALIPRCFSHFPDDTINVFVGHMLIDGSEIGEGGGERKLHIGHNFAVNAACFPATASYVALGHVHKLQQIGTKPDQGRPGSPTFYSGSLLQLDFGESGQRKYVNMVDVAARRPADPSKIEITGGRGLQTITVDFDALTTHADKFGDDYLRVIVRADRPVPSLFEQVREVLPNALDVTLERSDEPAPAEATASARGLAPHELLARYYLQRHNAEIPDAMIALFNELYEAEAGHAPA